MNGRMIPGMAIIASCANPALRGTFMALNSSVQSAGMGIAAFVGGQIISRETLFVHLVGREYDGLDRAIDVRISRLRKHLEQTAPAGLSIVTVRGQGYLFNYLPERP